MAKSIDFKQERSCFYDEMYLIIIYLPSPEAKARMKTDILQHSWIYETHIEILNTTK